MICGTMEVEFTGGTYDLWKSRKRDSIENWTSIWRKRPRMATQLMPFGTSRKIKQILCFVHWHQTTGEEVMGAGRLRNENNVGPKGGDVVFRITDMSAQTMHRSLPRHC